MREQRRWRPISIRSRPRCSTPTTRAHPPRVDEDGYIPFLRELVAEHDVRLIVPLTDLDHVKLVRARDELGALVLLPPEDVVRRVGDKYLAHLFFEERGIPSPPSWLPADVPGRRALPAARQGARGVRLTPHLSCRTTAASSSSSSATRRSTRSCRPAAAGEEFSIDVFCDLGGRCLNAIPRTMIQSKGGESIKGMTIQDRDLIEFGAHVAEAVGLVGPGTIQCFREDDGRHEVTDVNPRFGGAFPLPLAAGSRYPELALQLANGERPEPRLGEFRAGVVMTRFFSHLCLTAGDGGSLVPFAEELPEPVAAEPGEA